MVEKGKIELIPEEVIGEKKKEKVQRLANAGGVLFLIICALVTVGLLAVLSAQKSALSNVQKQVAAKQAELSSMVDMEKKIIGLDTKSSTLTSVLSERRYYSLLLDALEKSLSYGVSIVSLGIDSNNTIGITGEVQSYDNLAAFLRDAVDPEKGGSLFEEVILSSVNFSATGGAIQFNATISFPAEALKGGWESLLGEGWESRLDENWEALRKEKELQ